MEKKVMSFLRTCGICVFALGGWIAAWMMHGGEGQAEVSSERTKSSRVREARAGDRQRGSDHASQLVTDAPFARLLESLQDISTGARPGEANQKLVAACKKALSNADAERRRRDFYLLMELMRPEDAAAIHRQFLEIHHDGRGYGPEYATFAHRWGEVDAPGALDYMLAEKPFRMPEHDFQCLIRGWSTKDPQAALGWMKEHPDMTTDGDGRYALLEGWIRDDPGSATKWLTSESMSPDELAKCVSGGTHQQLYGNGLTGAAKWLSELPDDGGAMSMAARSGWQAIQGQLSQLSYDEASSAWSQVAGASWMTLNDFDRFGNNVSHATDNAEEGLPGYLNAVAAKWPADQVSRRFEQWAEANPAYTAQWLAKSPDSALLKPALEGAIQALEKSNPAMAEQLRGRLEESR